MTGSSQGDGPSASNSTGGLGLADDEATEGGGANDIAAVVDVSSDDDVIVGVAGRPPQ
ncbi:MAG: hypothetical protein GY772_22980 [bacterium]|nr:hypothetical protein [bacterium]